MHYTTVSEKFVNALNIYNTVYVFLAKKLSRRIAHELRSQSYCTSPHVAKIVILTYFIHIGFLDCKTLCRAASGEWEGVTATFDPEGRAMELPSRYVPDEYAQWGQKIFDWQVNQFIPSAAPLIFWFSVSSLFSDLGTVIGNVGCTGYICPLCVDSKTK